jgi:hypothetical protein
LREVIVRRIAAILLFLCLSLTLIGCKNPSSEATGVQKLMLGHWQNGGGSEIFLSPDTMTLVTPDGKKYTVDYRVTGGDKEVGTLIIKVNMDQAKKVKSEYVAFTGASDTNIMSLENGVLKPDNFLFNPSGFKYVGSEQSP